MCVGERRMVTEPAPDKAALRKALKDKRAQAYRQLPKAGDALASRLPEALFDPAPTCVAGYVPIHSEISPGETLALFRSAGVQLALPAVTGPDTPLTFRAFDFGQPLVDTPLGIAEPEASAPTRRPDVVLVPVLGWSHDGGRLGYGAGYYDRTLGELRARGSVIAVGLAFEVQRVWDLPLEPHDQPLDWIITESAAYDVTGSSRGDAAA